LSFFFDFFFVLVFNARFLSFSSFFKTTRTFLG
jgi:hypothetical protein